MPSIIAIKTLAQSDEMLVKYWPSV